MGCVDNSSVIRYNNFENNTKLTGLSSYVASDINLTVNAEHNWWDITDENAASQLVNSGLFFAGAIEGPFFVEVNVNVAPILMAPNSQAAPEANNYPATIEVSQLFPTAEPPQSPTTPTEPQPANPKSTAAQVFQTATPSPALLFGGISGVDVAILGQIVIIITLLICILALMLRKQYRPPKRARKSSRGNIH